VLAALLKPRVSTDAEVLLSASGSELVRLEKPPSDSLVDASQPKVEDTRTRARRTPPTLERRLVVAGRTVGRLTALRTTSFIRSLASASIEDVHGVEVARITNVVGPNAWSMRYVCVFADRAEDWVRGVAITACAFWACNRPRYDMGA
jgi:hypothetical protein